jgi:hypothetical protein
MFRIFKVVSLQISNAIDEGNLEQLGIGLITHISFVCSVSKVSLNV